jgi:RsiW-degrading membrane proteinase PrsW (M82 family)
MALMINPLIETIADFLYLGSKVAQKPLLTMGLFALAVAPGLAICLYILYKDKYNKEPLWMLVMAFLLGVLSILPALAIQLVLTGSADRVLQEGPASIALFTFGVVAISEEGSKFLVLRLFLYPRKSFDDPFDGIVYAVMVGMGFATIENIGYVYEHGAGTGVMRMFLSVPAHATFAVLMGYYVGFAKFGKVKNRAGNFFMALLMPVLFHGSFDFFIFAGKDSLVILGALVSLVVALVLSFRAIRSKQALSKNYSEQINPL